MQQGPDATPLELISISEAARKIGVNKSTLSRQIESGAVRFHDGKFVLSQVLEDREKNVNLSQSRRKPAKPKGGRAAAKPGTVASTDATPGLPDATDADFEAQLAGGKMLPFAAAQRVKENFLARQRANSSRTAAGWSQLW